MEDTEKTPNDESGASMSTIKMSENGVLIVNNIHINTKRKRLFVSLPKTSRVDDVITIVGTGSSKWTVKQGIGQQIFYGSATTTLGSKGRIISTGAHDCLKMVCQVSNTLWGVCTVIGNLKIV